MGELFAATAAKRMRTRHAEPAPAPSAPDYTAELERLAPLRKQLLGI